MTITPLGSDSKKETVRHYRRTHTPCITTCLGDGYQDLREPRRVFQGRKPDEEKGVGNFDSEVIDEVFG